MIRLVKNIQFVHFDQLKSVVDLNTIEEMENTKELLKSARTQLNKNKAVYAAFRELFNSIQNSNRPEAIAIIMAEAVLERTLVQQNYFINAVLGGFKLLNDSAKADQIYIDVRNLETYKLIDAIINRTTPSGFDVSYKFSEVSKLMDQSRYENDKQMILASLNVIFDNVLDKNAVASAFKHAFCTQHPTHQQSSIRNLMATFYLMEDRVNQSCLLNKISHINTYNAFLPYS